MITKAEQRLLAKYGTSNTEEIISKKKAEPQVKSMPSVKSLSVALNSAECRALCGVAGLEYLDGYEERVIEYTLSDERVDRDGDIIVQSGINLENYMANPVCLLFHNSRDFPVGNCIKIWHDAIAKSTKGWMLFLDDRVDTSGTSDRAFRFAKSRAMRAGSIGFRGTEVKFPTMEERRILGMKDWGVLFTACELMEFSFCPVPSNAGAVSDALRKGVLKPEDLKFIETEKPEDEVLDMTKEELDALVKDGIGKAVSDLKTELESAKTEKAGRRISAANMKKLSDMHDHLIGGCKMLKDMIDDHTDPDEDEEEGDKAAEADTEKAVEDNELADLASAFSAAAEAVKK